MYFSTSSPTMKVMRQLSNCELCTFCKQFSRFQNEKQLTAVSKFSEHLSKHPNCITFFFTILRTVVNCKNTLPRTFFSHHFCDRTIKIFSYFKKTNERCCRNRIFFKTLKAFLCFDVVRKALNMHLFFTYENFFKIL